MDSKYVIVFFAFIVTANCLPLLSDKINGALNVQCNLSKSVLEPLKIDYCKTSGERPEDLLCNAITSIINDVCNKTSNISLEKVISSSKFNDTLENFCKNPGSLSGFSNLPKNVSENLKKISSPSCSLLCTLFDGTLNPLCPFLVSYAALKNPIVALKTENITNTETVKKQNSAIQDNPEPSKPAEKVTADIQKPPNESAQAVQLPGTAESKPNNKVIQPQDIPNNPLGEDTDGEGMPQPDQNPDIPPDAGLQGNGNVDPKLMSGDDFQEGKDTNDKEFKDGNEKSIDDPGNQLNPEKGEEISSNKGSNQEINLSSEESPFDEAESSHFFTYFVFISALCIFFYVAMYNKKKILALLIEGRRSNVKRRPNSAAYSKLDCTLEEAMASGPSTSSSNTLLY